MGRYLKAFLGGLLALMAAFGWAATLDVIVLWRSGAIPGFWGYEVPKTPWYWSLVLLIFAAGFYLAFRAAYVPKSK
jgi:hypothetical protein